ncbi:cysteine desulfurase family protein [Lipingzhangella sp. LS1_29]|uniref:Cysteine desulfurase family protein n=1 Tax=Lipingzhangella rawalii TaxID=2055835 RepID=A0ABU2H9M5_9ACTN|nr:cysteine desulfurase family protein [Lipingzhangella rawalii]MDS1272021.1 cysteine desulfurase family protein [Lipingzhangella rawalii]
MVYLDHAATTPVRAAVADVVSAEMGRIGNPSSLHNAGRRARRVVEEARETIAGALGATPHEVVFTGGGTEANNLAVKGLYWARTRADPRRRRILVSSVEHHAVLDAAHWLAEAQGAECVQLPVDEYGMVQPEAFHEELRRDPDGTALASVMWANNEVGTIQPVAELARIARDYDVPLHTDAVQAPAQLPVDFAGSGVSALTVSGHKLGGPMGVGALLLERGVEPTPVLHGGGQERDLRSGTVMTPLVAGMAAAVELVHRERDEHVATLTALRGSLLDEVRRVVPDVVLNGHPSQRLPGNVHLTFPGCAADALLLLLDAAGIACSTGSACTTGVAQPSHVLLAMGADRDSALGALRFTLGPGSSPADITELGHALGPAVQRARRAEAVRGDR